MTPAESCVAALLDAVAGRDVRALGPVLADDVSWQNVPHLPAVGRAAVVARLGGLMTWSDRVQWDVVSAAYRGTRAWVERVDRFEIDGTEYAVACNGVFDADGDGRLVSVRDYVDLGEWRGRVAPAMRRRREASPADVVARHLAAVQQGDTLATAADYAADAVLDRDGRRYRGWAELLDYFDTVPARLAGRSLRFTTPVDAGDAVTVDWTIEASNASAPAGQTVRGTDTFVVADGRIAEQRVVLAGADF